MDSIFVAETCWYGKSAREGGVGDNSYSALQIGLILISRDFRFHP